MIEDPLGNVHATTVDGEKRLDNHFERGVGAGCWDRSNASAPDYSPAIAAIQKVAPKKVATAPNPPLKQSWWRKIIPGNRKPMEPRLPTPEPQAASPVDEPPKEVQMSPVTEMEKSTDLPPLGQEVVPPAPKRHWWHFWR